MTSKKDPSKVIGRKYDRVSRFYDLSEIAVEKIFFSKWRKQLLGGLHGRILEVGVGTGKNLPYYPKGVDLTAIDISPKMMDKARKRADGIDVNFHVMDAQDMTFENDTFDFVVTTFVLCSVPDPINTIGEMNRVLKPDGKILTLDHVLSKNRAIRLWENLHNPIMVRLFGININRDTLSNFKRSGLNVEVDKHLAFKDVFRMFQSSKG